MTIANGVASIGRLAFENCTSLISVTIPGSVTNIGLVPFLGCKNMTAIFVDATNSSYSSLNGVLLNKTQSALIEYPVNHGGVYGIPDTVTSIGDLSFDGCTELTNITIPGSITNIGTGAFSADAGLNGIYFAGNAPSPGSYAFSSDKNATTYYLPGTAGWGATFGGLPTALWLPQIQVGGNSFGVATNQFGFNINWASGQTVVVEASTNLQDWTPISTTTLIAGTNTFWDSNWTNYPQRFYRLRSP